MAYVAPSTRSTGDLITASIWNQDVVDNMIAVKAAVDGVGDIAEMAVNAITAHTLKTASTGNVALAVNATQFHNGAMTLAGVSSVTFPIGKLVAADYTVYVFCYASNTPSIDIEILDSGGSLEATVVTSGAPTNTFNQLLTYTANTISAAGDYSLRINQDNGASAVFAFTQLVMIQE